MSTKSRNQSFLVGAVALAQYAICKTPAALVVTAADTDLAVCVVQDSVAIAGTVVGVTHGPTKMIASTSIASAGLELASAGGGKVKLAASGDLVIGKSEASASGDGAIFDAFLNIQSVVKA